MQLPSSDLAPAVDATVAWSGRGQRFEQDVIVAREVGDRGAIGRLADLIGADDERFGLDPALAAPTGVPAATGVFAEGDRHGLVTSYSVSVSVIV